MSVDGERVRIGLGEAESADIVVGGTIKDLFSEADSAQLCLCGSNEQLERFKAAFVVPA
jgi:hypothetical protein